MGIDNFNLRLNDFECNVKTFWQELQNESNLQDITLVCDHGQIKAHRVVLASCSPALRNIIKLNKDPNLFIYLRKVKLEHLQKLIDFMYQGEAEVHEDNLPTFLEVAEDLKVKGLSEGNLGEVHSKSEEPQVNYSKSITKSPERKPQLNYQKSITKSP